MGDYPWFRVYSEILSDRKLQRIRRMTGLKRIEVRGAWLTILAMANDSPERGCLFWAVGLPITEEDIADDLELDLDTTQKLLEAFRTMGMLHEEQGVTVCTNWGYRQYESDSSTPRVQAYRARKKAEETEEPCNVTSPLQERFCNAPDTDTETEDTAETEQIVPASRAENATGEEQPPPIVNTPTIPAKSTVKAVPELLASRFEQPDPALKDVWREFLSEMRGQMTQQTYDTWYSGLSPGPIENGCVYIGVPSSHTHDWLQFRHQPMIKRTLDSLLGTPHDVTFQVVGETPY
jgi:hypothetical protein